MSCPFAAVAMRRPSIRQLCAEAKPERSIADLASTGARLANKAPGRLGAQPKW
jgi:hypothetical protein